MGLIDVSSTRSVLDGHSLMLLHFLSHTTCWQPSPKMDKRFTTNNINDPSKIPQEAINIIPTDSITYQTYLQSESTLDQLTSQRLSDSQSQLLSLSPKTIQRSIDILAPYIQPRRLQRIHQVLQQRTKHARFLLENPSNPSNVWACLRMLDSFGIQYVHVMWIPRSIQGRRRSIRSVG